MDYAFPAAGHLFYRKVDNMKPTRKPKGRKPIAVEYSTPEKVAADSSLPASLRKDAERLLGMDGEKASKGVFDALVVMAGSGALLLDTIQAIHSGGCLAAAMHINVVQAAPWLPIISLWRATGEGKARVNEESGIGILLTTAFKVFMPGGSEELTEAVVHISMQDVFDVLREGEGKGMDRVTRMAFDTSLNEINKPMAKIKASIKGKSGPPAEKP